ncbi:hypothetical protein FB567DRAFT_332941 [Paraphoma chrysanthemicola]|uniref:BTB domain-containing protein n=1 Tax=Paraphoma chrysanthemicola TaxID=798071 RepID=A0A8K0R9W4_9PLEO|nr:hypothetical protein FB567DRAFT_332941 [Paraphoma chrysanthemicola]
MSIMDNEANIASVLQTPGRNENQFQAVRASGRTRLQLLMGPGIDLVIGGGIGSKTSNSTAVTWSLPQALLSQYSKKIKEECSRDNQEPKELRITMPAVDPSIFELFVAWIYDGSYTTEFASLTPTVSDVNLDTQAWVLGETLQSHDFKNYAMDRIFNRYASAFGYKPLTTTEVIYACNHTAEGSKLRQFFFDSLAAHFTDTRRVEGSVADWDEVMQKHTDLRMYLLMGIRSAPNALIKSMAYRKEKYMEVNKAVEAPSATKQSKDKVVPAKRTVDGTQVKKEPTDN